MGHIAHLSISFPFMIPAYPIFTNLIFHYNKSMSFSGLAVVEIKHSKINASKNVFFSIATPFFMYRIANFLGWVNNFGLFAPSPNKNLANNNSAKDQIEF
jgi:hypothetical protein